MANRQRIYNRPHTCEQCGKTFYASRYDAKYCSSTCRTHASRQVHARDKLISKVYEAWLNWQYETRKSTVLTEWETVKINNMLRQMRNVLQNRDWQLPLSESSGWEDD